MAVVVVVVMIMVVAAVMRVLARLAAIDEDARLRLHLRGLLHHRLEDSVKPLVRRGERQLLLIKSTRTASTPGHAPQRVLQLRGAIGAVQIFNPPGLLHRASLHQ